MLRALEHNIVRLVLNKRLLKDLYQPDKCSGKFEEVKMVRMRQMWLRAIQEKYENLSNIATECGIALEDDEEEAQEDVL